MSMEIIALVSSMQKQIMPLIILLPCQLVDREDYVSSLQPYNIVLQQHVK
jgi:hypothetical protein